MMAKASSDLPRDGEKTTNRSAPKRLRKVIAFRALSRISACLAGSSAAPLNEMVMTCRPRLESSFSICSGVMLYLVRICGYCVRRSPIKPVSCMTSRMSVKFDPGNEFHRLEPSAHLTFLLAGTCAAACARNPARPIIACRLFITELCPKYALLPNPKTRTQVEMTILFGNARPGFQNEVQQCHQISEEIRGSEVEGPAVHHPPY